MKNLHWVGIRQSDIAFDNIFDSSTTIFGNNIKNRNYSSTKRINHNEYNEGINDFFHDSLLETITKNPKTTFMFYDPMNAYKSSDGVAEKTCCLNEFQLLSFLSEKIKVRSWLAAYCESVPSITLPANECSVQNIKKFFPEYDSFIVQNNISSGGFGTYLLSDNTPNIKNNSSEKYLVSPYFTPSYSINIHAILYEKATLNFPGSIQLILPDSANRMVYRGADFGAFASLSDDIKEQVTTAADSIIKQLRRSGYKGIVGIDFIAYNNIVYFLEINPRFQASTALLNQALLNASFPSIYELNLESFTLPKPLISIPNMQINSSNFNFFTQDIHSKYIRQCAEATNIITVDLDGFSDELEGVPSAYQFRLNFPFNISNTNNTDSLLIHPNLLSPLKSIEINQKFVKFELLNQGVRVSPEVVAKFDEFGGLNVGVFNAIDVEIFSGLMVNCPYNTKLSDLSPYMLSLNHEQELILSRYNYYISNAKVEARDKLAEKYTLAGVRYGDIITLTTDRIRINHTPTCDFKKTGDGCLFCDLPCEKSSYQFEDISEAVDYYLDKGSFRHILLGGGSNLFVDESTLLQKITLYLKKKCNKKIYVMCLPLTNIKSLNLLHDSGVAEIAFNIEIFDTTIARKLMPGKGLIAREDYFNAFKSAVKIWGNEGNVKSIIIVGLEPFENLIEGTKKLCAIGVQPIFSLFRPMPDTSLADYMPPATDILMDLYEQLNQICKEYNQIPGPDCVNCQNNTFSFPPMQ